MRMHTMSPQLARAMLEHRRRDQAGDSIRRKAGQNQALRGFEISKQTKIGEHKLKKIVIIASAVQTAFGNAKKIQESISKESNNNEAAANKTKESPDKKSQEPDTAGGTLSFGSKVLDAAVDATKKMSGLAQESTKNMNELRGRAVSFRAQAASGTAAKTDQQMDSLMREFKVEA